MGRGFVFDESSALKAHLSVECCLLLLAQRLIVVANCRVSVRRAEVVDVFVLGALIQDEFMDAFVLIYGNGH